MPNLGYFWKAKDIERLKKDYTERRQDTISQFCIDWAKDNNLTTNQVRGKLNNLIANGKLQKSNVPTIVGDSPYPAYTEPLIMEGDCLIIPDLELPFHHAEFVNNILSLAVEWNIKQCIFAGDILHFASLSGWEANWTKPKTGGITSSAERELMNYAMTLSKKAQGGLMDLIAEIGEKEEDDGVSTELNVARKELRNIEQLFDKCDFVLGNHEGRLLRALGAAMNPEELLRLVDIKNPKWRIAPFYFSYLDTSRGRYIIEHPKGAAESTAQGLAAKFQSHIIMCHSHALDFSWDISGKYFAIQTGCCVDENRLPYAAQRHTTKRQHKLGATIVKDGYPFLLHVDSPWDLLKRI